MTAWIAIAVTVAIAAIGGIAAMVRMMFGIRQDVKVISAELQAIAVALTAQVGELKVHRESDEGRIRALEIAVARGSAGGAPAGAGAGVAGRVRAAG